jgi:hypothetical protein
MIPALGAELAPEADDDRADRDDRADDDEL